MDNRRIQHRADTSKQRHVTNSTANNQPDIMDMEDDIELTEPATHGHQSRHTGKISSKQSAVHSLASQSLQTTSTTLPSRNKSKAPAPTHTATTPPSDNTASYNRTQSTTKYRKTLFPAYSNTNSPTHTNIQASTTSHSKTTVSRIPKSTTLPKATATATTPHQLQSATGGIPKPRFVAASNSKEPPTHERQSRQTSKTSSKQLGVHSQASHSGQTTSPTLPSRSKSKAPARTHTATTTLPESSDRYDTAHSTTKYRKTQFSAYSTTNSPSYTTAQASTPTHSKTTVSRIPKPTTAPKSTAKASTPHHLQTASGGTPKPSIVAASTSKACSTPKSTPTVLFSPNKVNRKRLAASPVPTPVPVPTTPTGRSHTSEATGYVHQLHRQNTSATFLFQTQHTTYDATTYSLDKLFKTLQEACNDNTAVTITNMKVTQQNIKCDRHTTITAAHHVAFQHCNPGVHITPLQDIHNFPVNKHLNIKVHVLAQDTNVQYNNTANGRMALNTKYIADATSTTTLTAWADHVDLLQPHSTYMIHHVAVKTYQDRHHLSTTPLTTIVPADELPYYVCATESDLFTTCEVELLATSISHSFECISCKAPIMKPNEPSAILQCPACRSHQKSSAVDQHYQGSATVRCTETNQILKATFSRQCLHDIVTAINLTQNQDLANYLLTYDDTFHVTYTKDGKTIVTLQTTEAHMDATHDQLPDLA